MARLSLIVDPTQAEQGYNRARQAGERYKTTARGTSRATDRVEGSFRRLNSQIFNVRSALGGLGLGLVARQMANLSTQALSTAENLSDVSDRVGVGVERLQELRFAFDQNGVAADQVDSALRRFQRRIGLAAEDTGAAAKSVDQLGIQLQNADGTMRATEAILNDVIGAIAGLGSESEQAAQASQFFGEDAGPAMAVLLGQGIDAIDDYGRRLRDLGGVMEDDMVRQAAAASAELRAFRSVTGTAFERGIVQGFTAEFDGLEQAIDNASDVAEDFGQTVGGAFGTAVDSLDELLEGLERAARLILGVAGALRGGAIGSRFGLPGTIGGAAIGGAAGALSPEIAGLLFSGLGDEESVIEQSNSRLRDLVEERDRLKSALVGVENAPLQEERLQQLSGLIEREREILRQRSGFDPEALDPLGRLFAPAGEGGVPDRPDAPGGPSTSRDPEEFAERIRAQAELTRQFDENIRTTIDGLAREADETLRLADALEVSESRHAAVQRSIEAENIARDLGISIKDDEFQTIEQLLRARDREAERIENIRDRMAEAEEETRRLDRAADRLGFTFSSAFEDAIVAGNDLSSVLQGLLQDIQRIVLRTLVTEPAGNFLSSALGGFSSGLFGGLFGGGSPQATASFGDVAAVQSATGFGSTGSLTAIQGSFADGGEFRVDSGFPEINAGRDNRLVSFAARDGETVSVMPPGMPQKQASSGPTNVYNIDARGADEARIAELESRLIQLGGAVHRVDRSIDSRAVAAVQNNRGRTV